MDKIINHEILKECFSDIISIQHIWDENIKQFNENIEKLDFLLKRIKISWIGEYRQPNIDLIKKIWFYLFWYLSWKKTKWFLEHTAFFKNKWLCISWLIFELLSDYEEDNKVKYLLYSSICYSLSWKEANSICIARSLENITKEDALFLIISKTLQRDFKGIIYNQIIEDSIKLNWIVNNFIQILHKNAGLFIDWADDKRVFFENLKWLQSIKEELIYKHETSLLFIISKTEEVITEMINNSVWNLLLPLWFSRDYILSLTKYSDKNFYELWEWQRKIIQPVLATLDKRILINMPTSWWKTFIAELAIINLLENHSDKKIIYVVPTNALANQVEEDFFYKFRSLWYKISNNVDIWNDVAEIKENMLILTPEKLDLIIRKNPDFIEQIWLFIFDEFHRIQDEGRWLLLETLITFLMLQQDIESCDYKIMTISAIVDNLENINKWFWNENWLFQSSWTPTRKLYWILKEWFSYREWLEFIPYDLIYKYGETPWTMRAVLDKPTSINSQEKQIYLISSLIKLIYSNDKSPILIYFLSKEKWLDTFVKTDFINEYWSQFWQIFINENDYIQRKGIDDLKEYLKLRLSEDHPLTKIIQYGIGFHDWDLPKDVRIEIENAYKEWIIKLLLATSTLADWVNLPIKNLIFHNTNALRISDFRNIIGRVWRAAKETEWNIYFINSEWLTGQLGNSLVIRSSLDNIKGDDGYHDFLDCISEMDEGTRLEFLKKFDRIQVYIYSTYEYIKDNHPSITLDSIQEHISKTLYLKNKSPEQVANFNNFNKGIYEKVEDLYENHKEFLEIINMTWLSDQSFRNLMEIVWEVSWNYIFNDDFPPNRSALENVISRNVYEKILKIREFQVVIENNEFDWLDNYGILLSWINWASLLEMRDDFFMNEDEISKRTSRAVGYLSTMFEYVLPWAFSSFSIIADNLYSFPQDISNEIKLFPLKTKHWIKTNYWVELVKLWIEYHELLVSLERLYIEEKAKSEEDEAQEIFFMGIKEWLLNYSFYKLEAKLPILRNNTSFIKNIWKVKNKIREKTCILEETWLLEFEVRWIFNNHFKKNLEIVTNVSEIGFQRDYKNIYDMFAVRIKYGYQTLGYVPSEYSEEISDYLKRWYKIMATDLNKEWTSIKIRIS